MSGNKQEVMLGAETEVADLRSLGNTPLQVRAQVACPECKCTNPINNNFCGECGRALDPNAPDDRNLAIVLKALSDGEQRMLSVVQKPVEKTRDWWDKLSCFSGLSPFATLISGILLAGAGAFFTYTNNVRQQRLAEV